MRVRDLMRTDVKIGHPDMTIGDAVLILADEHISALPVVGMNDRLVGVLSTTDILTAVSEAPDQEARDRIFETTRVEELMTPHVYTIEPGADAKEAARNMLYLEVHRLFVEENGKLVGVISQTDIVGGVATAPP